MKFTEQEIKAIQTAIKLQAGYHEDSANRAKRSNADAEYIEYHQTKLTFYRGIIEKLNTSCSCGETENLTECRAIPDSTYHLCQVCKRDEEQS